MTQEHEHVPTTASGRRLVAPATTRSVAGLRASASAVAAGAGWPDERVADVALVVSELCAALLAAGESAEKLRLTCRLDGALLFIDARLPGGAEHVTAPGLAVLDTLVEEYQLGAENDAASIRVTLLPERPRS